MTKVKILTLLVGMVLLFTLPASVSAQPAAHQFAGRATLDGAVAPDGTIVTAWIDGNQEGSATVSNGFYNMIVAADPGESFAGEIVAFQIGGNNATPTGIWGEESESEDGLTSLTASSAMAGEVVPIDLDELIDSGQSGTATLTEMGSMTLVEVTLSAGALESELVHIHFGQCGNALGDVDITLNPFVGGSGNSTTTVDVTLAMIQDGNHAINAHDASDPSMWTACGNIPGGAMVMAPTPMAMAPGATGVPGARGSAGPAGSEGAAGPVGAQGDTGPAGSAGRAGAQGDTGAAGSAGAQGDTGPGGSPGSSGPTGAGGAAGAEGDDGSNVLGIIALILAIIAIVGAGGAFLLGRRS